MNKVCGYCKKLLKRKIGKDGIMEYPFELRKRRFCNVSCAVKYRSGVEKVKYKCMNCGEEFYDYASNRKKKSDNVFCSVKCSSKYRFRNKKKCLICGKEVRYSRHNYCSTLCRGKSQRKGQYIKCSICGKETYFPLNRIKKTNIFFCSTKCKHKDDYNLLEKMRLSLRKVRMSNGLTMPEKNIKNILDILGVVYEREKKIGKYWIDFYVPSKNLCIEADGDYWHGNKNTDKYVGSKNQVYVIKKDIEKKKYLEERGFSLLRFWETDIKKNKEEIYANIKRAI